MSKISEQLAKKSEEMRLYALSSGLRNFVDAKKIDRLEILLTDIGFLQLKLEMLGIDVLADDYDLTNDEYLKMVQSCIINTSHIVSSHYNQLGQQLYGRLLDVAENNGAIRRLLDNIKNESDAAILLALRPFEPNRGALVRTIIAHNRRVNAVAVSNDSQFLVSASGSEIKIWTFDGGELLHTCSGQNGRITHLAISGDDKKLVSASDNGSLCVWNIEDGMLLHKAQEHGTKQRQKVVSETGHSYKETFVADIYDLLVFDSTAFTASIDKTIIKWDLNTGKAIEKYKVEKAVPSSLVLLSEPNMLAVGLTNGEVWMLDVNTGVFSYLLTAKVDRNFPRVSSLAVSSDGNRLTTLTDGATIRIWDIKKAEPRPIHIINHQAAMAMSMSRDDKILTGGFSGALKLTMLVDATFDDMQDAHQGGIDCITTSTDNQYAITGGGDNSVRIWRLAKIKSHESITPTAGHNIAERQGKIYSFAGNLRSEFSVWNPFTDKVIQTFKLSGNPMGTRAVSLDGTLIAVSYNIKSSIRVLEVETGSVRSEIKLEDGTTVNSLAFSPDNRHLYVGLNVTTAVIADGKTVKPSRSISKDKLLSEYNIERATISRYLVRPRYQVGSLLTISEQSLIETDGDNFVLWQLGETITQTTYKGSGSAIAYADNLLATGGSDGFSIFNLSTRTMHRFRDLDKSRTAIAISPDGKLLAAVSKDHTLRIWDVESRKFLTYFVADNELSEVVAVGDKSFAVTGDSTSLFIFEVSGSEPNVKPPLPKPSSAKPVTNTRPPATLTSQIFARSRSQNRPRLPAQNMRRLNPLEHTRHLPSTQVHIHPNIDLKSEVGKWVGWFDETRQYPPCNFNC